jgi:hypothetical protein
LRPFAQRVRLLGSSEGAATASSTTVCESADTKVAILKDGLVTLTKSGDLYAVGSEKASALTLAADKKTAKFKSAKLTCAPAGADEAAWAIAGAMASYESDIDGLASQVVDEMNGDGSDGSGHVKSPKPYLVFAVETSKRGSLDLGTTANKSTGKLPGGGDTLSDDDNSYGGLSAAYDLGGGDDYGEWFQGASDSISIGDSITKPLGSEKAGFVAHEKCKALSGLVGSKDPSAVELTVGSLTFLIPNDFSK